MKLSEKYNRINIIASITALLVSGICCYFFIRYELIERLDNNLKIEELEVFDFIKLNKKLPAASVYKDQNTSFELTGGTPVKREFRSRWVYNQLENKEGTIREIVFPVYAENKAYKAMISISQQETDDLIQLILLITVIIMIALLIVLYIINRFLLNKVWKPFNITLEQLKQFNLTGKKELSLEKSDINEFVDLNTAVTIMSDRVNQDYEALKSFTENASHEIQTPLAIIQSRLELLMQSESFLDEQARHIQSMHDACVRLSKLNQSLILLTKIGNQQFQQKDTVYPGTLIRRLLCNYEELIAAQNIGISMSIDDECKVIMNEVMAEILFSNLVTNAIRHNIKEGKIEINLTKQQLITRNTGPALKIRPVELFERFRKDNQESSSLGLGLSIVQKICEQNNFSVDYQFTDALHILTVKFTW